MLTPSSLFKVVLIVHYFSLEFPEFPHQRVYVLIG